MVRKRRKRNHVQRKQSGNMAHLIDVPILSITLILLIIGVIAVFEASVIEAYHQFGDQLYFAKRQLQWALLGLICMAVVSHIPVKWFKQLAVPGFIVSLILLLLVLIPGFGVRVGGAKRWLDFGPIVFQPAEVTKVALILYFSALFEKNAKLAPFIGSLGLIIGLIMLQPDLGTTIVVSGVALTLYFLSGAKWREIGGILVSGVSLGLILILSSPYRRARLLTFLDPGTDPQGTSYHIRQIIISLGSGGFFGTGIGRSLQKYRYLPEATTDSIFAVIGEELGFMGTLLIVGLFTMFVYRGFKIVQRLDDTFLKLLASGVTVLIVIQAFLNLSAMGALVPLTGITLPFISYGGSSLVISLIAVGILLNVSRYTQKKHANRRR